MQDMLWYSMETKPENLIDARPNNINSEVNKMQSNSPMTPPPHLSGPLIVIFTHLFTIYKKKSEPKEVLMSYPPPLSGLQFTF